MLSSEILGILDPRIKGIRREFLLQQHVIQEYFLLTCLLAVNTQNLSQSIQN
jgi:hypothetical protein